MLDTLRSKLEPFGQTHVLRFWEKLSPQQQQRLTEQIEAIDFAQLQTLCQSSGDESKWGELADAAEVPPAITLADFANPESYDAARKRGLEAMAAGKTGLLMVAGGQGSRLGFNHPKGMFPIGPISDRTLYQMIIEQVLARSQQVGATIPLYIMTSPPTHAETSEFLESHNFFGMNPDDLTIFSQGTMPAIDDDGKLLLSAKDEIFVSPDGHGGTLRALDVNGCLNDMQARGVEHLCYGQIDNPLIQAVDPALIGYHIDSGSEMTSQVVRKNDPMQKVGNVVKVGDRAMIIEYSDLPEENARQTNADGTLKFWAGSIAVHVIDTEFLRRSAADADSLPFHRANKKVPFIDDAGNEVEPDSPNATKFEKFIFDLLPSAKNAIICEVDPEEGFCALKNAPPAPAETEQHVREAISSLHRKWLVAAGADLAPGVTVEISPLYAPDRESLIEKLPAGSVVDTDTFFV